jgi:porphobilinogen synthase
MSPEFVPSLVKRPRRVRNSEALRSLVAETTLEPRNLMAPLFVREGLAEPRPIASMPGVVQHTLASLPDALTRVRESGVKSVMLFAIPEKRDHTGSEACSSEGILHRAVSVAAESAGSSLVIGADVCLDEFTSHGHCGVLDASGNVDNDLTLAHYQEMARGLARAGAELLGLSGMMDGQVVAVRAALEDAGLKNTLLMAYAAKYASNHYGPFRDAVESTLEGDRKTYQMDWRNRREALNEVVLDLEQGADVVMVKPALSYLDIIRDVRNSVSAPLAAYVVSGEFAMIELAAKNGLVNRDNAVWEALYSVRRAGADIICTYWAVEFAEKMTRGHGYRG